MHIWLRKTILFSPLQAGTDLKSNQARKPTQSIIQFLFYFNQILRLGVLNILFIFFLRLRRIIQNDAGENDNSNNVCITI